MLTARSVVLLCITLIPSEIRAQAAAVELEAGLGYARVFDAGGLSFAAAVNRSLSSAGTGLQHALGGSLWYAHTGIATGPIDNEGRHMVGVGVRYQVGLLRAKSLRPFLAVPVQLLHSRIADRPTADQASLASYGVPKPEPAPPVEDQVGGAWGWGAGLELGFRIGVGERLSGQTSVQALYQDIYGGDARHGAWNWHAGISYALRGN
jgi:hypothetical protein